MNRLVVDASVVVKWLMPEVHGEYARLLLEGKREYLAPDLIWSEVGNAVWKKSRRQEITFDEAREILSRFKKISIETSTTQLLLDVGLELADRIGAGFYDCLYLALALMNRIPFVTADRKFYESLYDKNVPGEIIWIEDVK